MLMPEDIKHKVYVHWALLRDVFFSHLTNLTWATPKRARFGVPKREGSSVATCWDHVLPTFWRHWHPQLHVLNVYEHPALCFFFCVLGQKNDATLLPHVFIWPRCFHNAALCDPHIGTDHGLTSSGPQHMGAQKTQLVEAFFTWYTLSLFWKLRWAVWTPDLFNPHCLSPNQISLQI